MSSSRSEITNMNMMYQQLKTPFLNWTTKNWKSTHRTYTINESDNKINI